MGRRKWALELSITVGAIGSGNYLNLEILFSEIEKHPKLVTGSLFNLNALGQIITLIDCIFN